MLDCLERLLQHKKKHGLTNKDLAAALGLSETAIRSFIKERYYPSRETEQRILSYLLEE